MTEACLIQADYAVARDAGIRAVAEIYADDRCGLDAVSAHLRALLSPDLWPDSDSCPPL